MTRQFTPEAPVQPTEPDLEKTVIITNPFNTSNSSNPLAGGPSAPTLEETPPPRDFAWPALAHFDIRESIGRGGFGVVLKAFDQKLKRIVAIKMMPADMAATSPARKRFVREARAAAAVRHENVVHIYTVEEQPIPYMVLEYVPGGSLQQLLDRIGPLEVREVLRLGAQIARGLAAAHAAGVIHRDIKPANVLLEDGPQTRAKLTDFGIALAADDASQTQSGSIAGTPMYMAPEQASGEAADHRADLFSLGSVLYVMVSGRPPFRASNSLAVLKRVAEEIPRPIREIIPETPEWLCDIIGKLHARNPADRFQSAAEVAELLESCRLHVEHGEQVRLPANFGPQQKRNHKMTVAGAIAVALVAVVAVAIVYSTPNSPSAPDSRSNPVPAGSQAVATSPDDTRSTDLYTNNLGMKFVRVPAGSSYLSGGGGRYGDRKADFTTDFYLGKFEVTRQEWDSVMGAGTNPSRYTRNGDYATYVADVPDEAFPRFPVDGVSWDDCQAFLRELNRRAPETGWIYRLPTSDEWEYACRGGPGRSQEDLSRDFYFSEPTDTLRPDAANWKETGLRRPRAVGSYPPNRLGLHDMHGNVFEMLHEVVDNRSYFASGSCEDPAEFNRVSRRASLTCDQRYGGSGFRVARIRVPVTP